MSERDLPCWWGRGWYILGNNLAIGNIQMLYLLVCLGCWQNVTVWAQCVRHRPRGQSLRSRDQQSLTLGEGSCLGLWMDDRCALCLAAAAVWSPATLRRSLILCDHSPTLITPSTLNHLLTSVISKSSRLRTWGFNIGISRRCNSIHSNANTQELWNCSSMIQSFPREIVGRAHKGVHQKTHFVALFTISTLKNLNSYVRKRRKKSWNILTVKWW